MLVVIRTNSLTTTTTWRNSEFKISNRK